MRPMWSPAVIRCGCGRCIGTTRSGSSASGSTTRIGRKRARRCGCSHSEERLMARCEICGRGPAPEHGGVTVIRQNEKGQAGIWRCMPHSDTTLDPETQRLVDVIEDRAPDEDDEDDL